jgi:glutathione S-transferase
LAFSEEKELKLYMSVNSPYVRIVRVLLREMGRTSEVQEIEVNPRDQETGFWSVNPVARIPALALPDGVTIAESDLICRYLDDRLAAGRFYAPLQSDPRRLSALGTAHAMLARGVAARVDLQRPGGPDHKEYVETQLAGVIRGADALEQQPAARIDTPDIADIAVACMVEWLNFRHPDLNILAGRPALDDWCGQVGGRGSMVATRPH